MDRPVTSRVRVALNALILLAGCLAGAGVAVATAQRALADTVPPAHPGWTTVFGDDFAGAAGFGAIIGQLVLRHRHGFGQQ